MRMKIVVFGSPGWLGRAILARAADHRAAIRAFDRGPEAWDEWGDLDGTFLQKSGRPYDARHG